MLQHKRPRLHPLLDGESWPDLLKSLPQPEGPAAGNEGPEWFRPAKRPEPLEIEGKTERSSSLIIIPPLTKVGASITTSFGGVGSFISFPLFRTSFFFFFFAGTPAGGEDMGHLSPGAFCKSPSYLFSSRLLRRALRDRASTFRTVA